MSPTRFLSLASRALVDCQMPAGLLKMSLENLNKFRTLLG